MKCKHKLQHHSDRHFYIIELWLEAFSFNWLFSAGQWITRGQFNLIISVFSIFILFFSIYQIQVNALLLGLKRSAINHSSLEANISMQEPRETINKKSWKLEGNDLLLVTLHHCVFLDVHEFFHNSVIQRYYHPQCDWCWYRPSWASVALSSDNYHQYLQYLLSNHIYLCKSAHCTASFLHSLHQGELEGGRNWHSTVFQL